MVSPSTEVIVPPVAIAGPVYLMITMPDPPDPAGPPFCRPPPPPPVLGVPF